MDKFDIVIIGSGAGLMLTQAAAMSGMKCAIIESGKFGGTCLTKGCIPSKMLVYPADVIRESEAAPRVGLSFEPPKVDWGKISERMWAQIGHSSAIEEGLKKSENIRVYNGAAFFTGKKTLKLRQNDGGVSNEIYGEKIVIANGARSFVPPIKNIESTGYITSETFFGEDFPQKPWKSVIIVGGGAVGAEFAHIFSAFGTKVTIIEARERILAAEEAEVSSFVESGFRANGIRVITGREVVGSGRRGAAKTLTVRDVKTGDLKVIEAEKILIASGVMPNNDLLSLENTDIKTDSKGWIKTNEYLETTQKDVYAIGDTNGKYQFRHKANYEAEILMHNLFTENERKRACYNSVPWAVFTNPQVAHVGMTQEQAEALGEKYWVGKNYYSRIAGGIAMGIDESSHDNGFVKLIVGRERTILGAHIVGPYASVLIQPFVYLMNINHKCEQRKVKKSGKLVCPMLGSYAPIMDSMVIHPSLSELTAWAIDNIDWSD